MLYFNTNVGATLGPAKISRSNSANTVSIPASALPLDLTTQ